MLPNDVTIMTVENSQLKASQSVTLTDSSSSNGGSVNANSGNESPLKSENGVSNETNLTNVEISVVQNGTVHAADESTKVHASLLPVENGDDVLDKQLAVGTQCMADEEVSPASDHTVNDIAANGNLPFSAFGNYDRDTEAEMDVGGNEDVEVNGLNTNVDGTSLLNENVDGESNTNVDGAIDADRNSLNGDDGDVNADRIECVIATADPPDGGYGWVIVAACITQNMIVDGVCFSFGAQLEPLRRTFADSGVRTQQLALVGSLVIGLYLFLGPFSGLLANRFGCRSVTVCGSLIAATAFVLTWATCPQGCVSRTNVTVPTGPPGTACTCSVDVLVLTYGIVAGVGFSMLYVPAIMIIGCYFERRRMLASGIAVVGSGLGITLGAPLVRFVIHQVDQDWHRAQLVVAGIVLLCALAGACFRPLPSRVVGPDSIVRERGKAQNAERTARELEQELERDGYAVVRNGHQEHTCSCPCEQCSPPEHERAHLMARRPQTCEHQREHRVAIVIKRSHIMQKIIEDKQRQRTVSNGSLDNCLITVKNEVIKAPPCDDVRRVAPQHRMSNSISDSLSQRLCSLLAGSSKPARASLGLSLTLGSRGNAAPASNGQNAPCNPAPGDNATSANPPTVVLSSPSRRTSSATVTTASGTPQRVLPLANVANRSVPTSRQASPGSSTISVQTMDPGGSASCTVPSPSRTASNAGRILPPANATTVQYESIKSAMISQALRALDKPLRRDMYLNSRARLPSVANVNEPTATATDSGCSTLNTNQQLTVVVTQANNAVRSNQHSPSPAAARLSVSKPSAAEMYARGNAVPSQTICMLSEDSIPQRRGASRVLLLERLIDTACFVHSRLRDTIDVTLLRRSWMGLLVLASVLTSIGFFVPFMFVVDAASRLDKQIPALRDGMDPVFLLSFVGIANTVGRVCTVLMTSVPWLDCFIINIVALLLAGVAAIAIPFCSSLEMLIICVCGYGICIAVFVALQSSVILELLGDSNAYRLNGALGVVLLVEGVSMIVGCCVAGHYYDTTGNYRQSFMFAGIVIFISGCLCMPLRHLAKRARVREHRRTRSRSPRASRPRGPRKALHEHETSSEHEHGANEQQETTFATSPHQDTLDDTQAEGDGDAEVEASEQQPQPMEPLLTVERETCDTRSLGFAVVSET